MGAWRNTGPFRTRRATFALTEGAPTNPTDGINAIDVSSFTPVLHAPAGQTFTGGVLQAWLYDGANWVRATWYDSDLGSVLGLQDGALEPIPVHNPQGQLALVPVGVTLSGAGTAIDIEYLCVLRGTRELPG